VRETTDDAQTGERFSLLPPQNASGNYVKVVQRVPVRINFDPALATNSGLGVRDSGLGRNLNIES
jgi:multidrug resistance efflux pump